MPPQENVSKELCEERSGSIKEAINDMKKELRWFRYTLAGATVTIILHLATYLITNGFGR